MKKNKVFCAVTILSMLLGLFGCKTEANSANYADNKSATPAPSDKTDKPAHADKSDKPDQSDKSKEESFFKTLREIMVRDHLAARDISDKKVLEVMRRIPRHLFVPPEYRRHSYADSPLPIGENQTISQPYIVAFMTQALAPKPSDTVLEIGAGSGYQAAVLAELTRYVYTIEIIPSLAERASETLKSLGYKNISVRCGDGYLGWPEYAPFDKIIVTAAPPTIPEELVRQLKPGGKMIVPVGTYFQSLKVITKNKDGTWRTEESLPVRFVPMVKGKEK